MQHIPATGTRVYVLSADWFPGEVKQGVVVGTTRSLDHRSTLALVDVPNCATLVTASAGELEIIAKGA